MATHKVENMADTVGLMARRKTHMIELQDSVKWTKTNECTLCGMRVGFESDWTAWRLFADCVTV